MMDTNIEAGQEIAGFRIDSLIGRGGMAYVYKVWHTTLHRFEAMKVLPPHLAMDSSFVERFLSEARTAARLRHHNIVQIHTVSGPDSPQPYFTMQLVEGGDLSDLIEARGCLTAEEALPILTQAAAALDYAHDQGVIHRDVKPGNMLLERQPSGYTVMVVDFGIARAQEASESARLTKTGMIVGTPEYMSPEQGGAGPSVDRRSDQYSLGIVAYELLTGAPPFGRSEGSSAISVIMSHIRDSVQPIARLPKAANAALAKALSKSPEDRFPTCSEFVKVLRLALQPENKAPVVTDVRQRRTWALPATILALVLMGTALLGYGLLKPRRIDPRSVEEEKGPIEVELETLERKLKERPEAVGDLQFLRQQEKTLALLKTDGETLTKASKAEQKACGFYYLAYRNELRATNLLATTKPQPEVVREVAQMRSFCAQVISLTQDRDRLSSTRDLLLSGDLILADFKESKETAERHKVAALIHDIDSRRTNIANQSNGSPSNAK